MAQNPLDAVNLAIRNELQSLSEADLQAAALARELRQEKAARRALEDRAKNVESALKVVGRVLGPYLPPR